MRIAAVILSRHQQGFAKAIAGALLGQDVRPDTVLSVLDRPSPGEADAIREAYSGVPGMEHLVIDSLPEISREPAPGVEPFCAGHCRNLALEYLDGRYDLAVFTDGDCIPYRGWLASHVAACSDGRVTVGRRRETKWFSMDQRQMCTDRPVDIFGGFPRPVESERYFADSGVTWTCNIGFTPGSVEALKAFNADVYGGRFVFHPHFTGRWGGEDTFLGIECFYGGIPVWTAPATGDDGVLHMAHPRPSGKYDHAGFVLDVETMRSDLVDRLSAAGRWHSPFRSLQELLGDRP